MQILLCSLHKACFSGVKKQNFKIHELNRREKKREEKTENSGEQKKYPCDI